MAFNSLLNNMELIKRIYLNATNGHRYQEVTKGMRRSLLLQYKYVPVDSLLIDIIEVIISSSRGISVFCTNDVPDNPVGSRYPVSSMRLASPNWVSILDLDFGMSFLSVDRREITWNGMIVSVDRKKKLGS